MSSGHSRIPIFVGSKDNVVGYETHNIILVDPENNTKVIFDALAPLKIIPHEREREMLQTAILMGRGEKFARDGDRDL
eukprot:749993-Hanusia_phi.AAC.3